MTDYREVNLFDEFLDDEADLDDMLLDQHDGYALYQADSKSFNDRYEYRVFDTFGVLVTKWESAVDCLSMTTSEYRASPTRKLFIKAVNNQKQKSKKAKRNNNIQLKEPTKRQYDYSADDGDVSWYRGFNTPGNYRSFSYYDDYYPRRGSTGFLGKLNKSDTLVIHCADSSTDMLAQIYQGKNWDVLRDGNIDKSELHELLKSHDRIVCLGHGTGNGLINVQGGGTVIGPEEASLLKNKKLFVIWCNADRYFSQHHIGKDQFITGNMPSEVWECRAAGCGSISPELMLENITYWSKLCADVVERALNGDAQGAVDYVRDKYIEKYGDHPVTIYNAERTKVQGKPLEDLSSRYWGPEELMHSSNTSSSNFSYNSFYNAFRNKSTAQKDEKETANDTSPSEDKETTDESFEENDSIFQKVLEQLAELEAQFENPYYDYSTSSNSIDVCFIFTEDGPFMKNSLNVFKNWLDSEHIKYEENNTDDWYDDEYEGTLTQIVIPYQQ